MEIKMLVHVVLKDYHSIKDINSRIKNWGGGCILIFSMQETLAGLTNVLKELRAININTTNLTL